MHQATAVDTGCMRTPRLAGEKSTRAVAKDTRADEKRTCEGRSPVGKAMKAVRGFGKLDAYAGSQPKVANSVGEAPPAPYDARADVEALDHQLDFQQVQSACYHFRGITPIGAKPPLVNAFNGVGALRMRLEKRRYLVRGLAHASAIHEYTCMVDCANTATCQGICRGGGEP